MQYKALMLCIIITVLIGSAVSQPITGIWSDQTSGSQTGQTLALIPQTGQTSLQPAQPQQTSQQTPQYSQYYSMSQPGPSGQAEGTSQFNIAGQQPSTLLVGGQQQKAVPYSQYQTYATLTGGNALWIQGTSSWTQYAQVPQGAYLSLIATTPSSGYGYLYEIYPSGRLDRNYYYFYAPYTRITFYADTVGQHILLFSLNNQVSNGVIVDVTGYMPGPAPVPSPTPGPTGRARINIISDTITGYDVYVDDVYQFTEGQGGIPDGYSSFTVTGNRDHKITIRKGGYSYSQTRYFADGGVYTLRIS